MRLNKNQIEALAKKIIETYKEEVIYPLVKYNKEIKDSKEYVDFIKNDEHCKILETYKSEDIKYGVGSTIERVQEHIRMKFFEPKLKKVPSTPYIGDVINEINLATIDKSDVASIIEAVKQNMWK